MSEGQLLGAIVGGGRSRRFAGRPKAWLPLAGRPFWWHVAARLKPRTACLIAAGWPEGVPPPAGFDFPSGAIACLPDAVAGLGPIAGLATALARARELGLVGALVVACDLPFVPAALLDRLVAGLATHDACVPRVNVADHDRPIPQPLAAAYGLAVGAALAPALKAERPRRIAAYLEKVAVDWLAPETLAALDPVLAPGGRGLVNLNTPADYERWIGPVPEGG